MGGREMEYIEWGFYECGLGTALWRNLGFNPGFLEQQLAIEVLLHHPS